MIPIKEWLKTDEVEYMRFLEKNDYDMFIREAFFRDPFRPVKMNPNVFLSPADGVVLYAHNSVDPDEALVEIKGKAFTPKEALGNQNYDCTSLVIGIFMSRFDVHVNRVPTSGYITDETKTPFLHTPNVSMVFEEDDLLEKGVVKVDHMEYLFKNERRTVKIYNPLISGSYYVVQIAERDINVINNWGNGGHLYQGERYGAVRYGSQVDLVIPLNTGTKYKVLAKEKYHVTGGVDPLVEIVR
jgi:phosphatidylserine decarboxylase